MPTPPTTRYDILKPLFYSVGSDAQPDYRVVWRVEESLRAQSAAQALEFALATGYVNPIVAPSSGDVACGDFLPGWRPGRSKDGGRTR